MNPYLGTRGAAVVGYRDEAVKDALLLSSSGEGAMAAISAITYVKRLKKNNKDGNHEGLNFGFFPVSIQPFDAT